MVSLATSLDALFNHIEENVWRDMNISPKCTLPPKEKIEKLFTQPKDLFEVVDFTTMDIIDEEEVKIKKFIKGEKYSLKGIACDGFEMREKIYEVVGEVNNFEGVKIDSLIVKQVGGERGQIFTLSKNDCAHLGIEYENGLQLFPKNLSWRRVVNAYPFDKNNLGTMPLSKIDSTIRYVLIKLNGFKDYNDGFILTPSGNLIKEKQFENSVRVQTIEPIVYGENDYVKDKTNLCAEIVYPKNLVFNHGNFISSDDSIYIMVKLAKSSKSIYSVNGLLGVDQKYFLNINPNDFFIISWDELGSFTIEEYEAEKERKAKEIAERIKKKEAEIKKRIEEEEKRIKAERERKEMAINRMKNYKIEMPKFPSVPSFDTKDTFASVAAIGDRLTAYFATLEYSLNEIERTINRIL